VRGDLGQSGGRSTPGKDEGIKGVPQPSSPPLGQGERRASPFQAREVRVLDKRGDVLWRECEGCGQRIHGNSCPRCRRAIIGVRTSLRGQSE